MPAHNTGPAAVRYLDKEPPFDGLAAAVATVGVAGVCGDVSNIDIGLLFKDEDG